MSLDYLCVCGYYLKDVPSTEELLAVMKEHRDSHRLGLVDTGVQGDAS